MRRSLPLARAAAYLLMLATAPSIWPRSIRASWFEPLVMPGDLVEKHARLERECNKCHEAFDKAAQDRLCLACHKEVATDVTQARGYHGQEPSVKTRACKTCHTEHKGRAANIIPLNRDAFDHRLTDMPLRGGHSKVRCDDCHVAGKRFRDASPRCASCHQRKDPHEGCLGEVCDKCHAETGWKTVRFDHDTAAFRLEGRHREAQCDGCHKTKRYKPTANTCAGCHERQDRHHGSFGANCQSCHTPLRKWAATEFDHARKTHFILASRHASVACEKCHTDGLAAERAPTACVSCHERDDHHRGQFGRACDTCHTPTEWKRYTFEHERSTHFALRGRHREIHCTECHRGNLHEVRLDKNCNSCHREDDVHRGRQGTRCERCHDERAWNRDVLVDHDSTRFPLTGAHARVACLQCHLSPVFKNVALECVSCHARDATAHRCQRGSDCQRCHETATFRISRPVQ